MRLLYGYTLLPGNIERCQWVNRYYRSKVLLNAAGHKRLKLYSAKALRVKIMMAIILLFIYLSLVWKFFYCIHKNLIVYNKSLIHGTQVIAGNQKRNVRFILTSWGVICMDSGPSSIHLYEFRANKEIREVCIKSARHYNSH